MNKKKSELKSGKTANIEVKKAKYENFYDLKLCAEEFLGFISNFKKKFFNDKLSVLIAYYNKTLAGVLVAEDKSYKVDSIERILPMMCIHLVYVSKAFRNRRIGTFLLRSFIKDQKETGIASVFAKIPKKYKKGIKFYLGNEFYVINRMKNKIFLKKELWNDYGIKKCHLIGTSLNDIFT
ncbi:MAG: GNAT family N-acetyltransferase [Promethearchaeia archaeon]